MNLITKDAVADVRFTLSWETPEARHTEVYRAPQLNLWRDILPHDIHDGLMGSGAGDSVEMDVRPICPPIDRARASP